jgi:hypothetical protein
LFELFAHRKERLIMIEKFGSGFDPSMVQNKFTFPEKSQPMFGTLKIACLLLGVGLGLLVGFLVSQSFGLNILMDGNNSYYIRESVGVIYGASVMLFGGFGLLVAFILEMRYTKKSKE